MSAKLRPEVAAFIALTKRFVSEWHALVDLHNTRIMATETCDEHGDWWVDDDAGWTKEEREAIDEVWYLIRGQLVAHFGDDYVLFTDDRAEVDELVGPDTVD